MYKKQNFTSDTLAKQISEVVFLEYLRTGKTVFGMAQVREQLGMAANHMSYFLQDGKNDWIEQLTELGIQLHRKARGHIDLTLDPLFMVKKLQQKFENSELI